MSIDTPTRKYKCENCSKEYSHRQGLYFHRNKCKVLRETEMNKILNVVTNQNVLVENQMLLIEKQLSMINNLTLKINEHEQNISNVTKNDQYFNNYFYKSREYK
jgi:hypothetical protein